MPPPKPIDQKDPEEDNWGSWKKPAATLPPTTLEPTIAITQKELNALVSSAVALDKKNKRSRVHRRHTRRQYSDSDDFDYDSEDDSEEHEHWKKKKGMQKKKITRQESFDSEEYEEYRR